MQTALFRLVPAFDALRSYRLQDLRADVRGALEATMARDETGPKIGEVPPDFFLKRLGSSDRVSLSSFRGRQPVALAFGSYT